MQIDDIIRHLEFIAPPAYQETYDNAGLITGSGSWACKGVLVCLDTTEEVVLEAMAMGCNMVVAHHPIVFGGLKKLNGKNYVEKAVICAIKNDIAIYAIHTNLDNVIHGVNDKMADLLNLQNRKILVPKENALLKLYTFVPVNEAGTVRDALFKAGAGHIGRYSECSFGASGEGTFTAGAGTNPFIGAQGKRETVAEIKLEVIFPAFKKQTVLAALKAAHPYEEVAYDLVQLANTYPAAGSGMIAELPEAMEETAFLEILKRQFGLRVIKHTPLLSRKIRKVALCGGAGSFLITKALTAGADVFVTSDIKYHEFFDANGAMIIADIGHYESEQFTIELLSDILQEKFPTFAVLKTGVKTNPVQYFL